MNYLSESFYLLKRHDGIRSKVIRVVSDESSWDHLGK